MVVEMSRSGNEGISALYIFSSALDNNTRPRRYSSASQTGISEGCLVGSDRRIDGCLDESSPHLEDVQLNDEAFVKLMSPFELVGRWKLDPSFCNVDLNEIEGPHAFQPETPSAQGSSEGKVIANKISIAPGLKPRGVALSSIEFWIADTRKVHLLGRVEKSQLNIYGGYKRSAGRVEQLFSEFERR